MADSGRFRRVRYGRARRPRRWQLAAALAAGALALTACGGSSGDESAEDSADRTPRAGGSLIFVAASDTRTLDPFQAFANAYTDNTRLNAVFDSLFWHEAGIGRVMPQVGESITPDQSNRVWTIKIKPNVTFTDGTPYDAAAVKWAFDQHANPERKSVQAAVVEIIDETTVVDPTTLRVTLKEPNSSFDSVVASSLSFIPSPTAFQKDPAAFGEAPVGAGPFTLKEWQPGDHMTFAKNPGYWQGPDKPYLDSVTFKVIPNGDQGLATIASGGADLNVSVGAEQSAKANDKGLAVKTVTQVGGESIAFNVTRPPFDDPRARRAIALALDADKVNEVAFHGNGTPTRSIFPVGSPYAPDGAETVPRPDRAEAQRLLDELAAEGKPLSFTYSLPQSPSALRTGEYIQSRLTTLNNIDVKIESVTIAAFMTQVVVQHNYQAAMYSSYGATPEPTLYAAFHSASPGNYLGYANPAADGAIQSARAATDDEQRRIALGTFADALRQDVPMWTYQSSVITASYGNDVAGLVLTQDGMVLTDRLGTA